MRDLELELQSRLPDFRRIWVQTSKLNSLCITLFPIKLGEDYRIIVRKDITDLSVDNLYNIIAN